MDMYKFAAQNCLRFPASRGNMTVENLFQMPLKATDGFDLDNVAKTINAELQNLTTESFIPDAVAKSSPRKKVLEVSLEIVKDVIATKVSENADRLNKLKKTEQRARILDALAAKKDQALSAASMEDLEKQLAALDE